MLGERRIRDDVHAPRLGDVALTAFAPDTFFGLSGRNYHLDKSMPPATGTIVPIWKISTSDTDR